MRAPIGWIASCLLCCTLSAQSPRVLPDGKLPEDARLGNLKTLNDHFPFDVPTDVESWNRRADQLRHRVKIATGLWPMPEKTPLESVVFGKIERDGFTVERVYFQSLPGHFVTGLLFRPEKSTGQPGAGVLCPHGHGGRLQKHSDAEIKRQIEIGGERFEKSGRMPKLARCAQLARMGCVCFIFDMLGYADSVQISHAVAHRHQDPRPEEADDQNWILFSAAADLRLQSIMGLQTWNAIRALDFLAGLPDVDPNRLAVTGGSGGGTQTILLGAIDPRVQVGFPNGMVSTSMQGGCYCENCNFLRTDTGNVELAALFAPKPQAMTAADDWTRDMMTDGYPELQRVYTMLGVPDNVYCRPLLEFKHNYNYLSRATMYKWMNKHLQLGMPEGFEELDYEPLSDQELAVWCEEHPAPEQVGVEHERAVCRWLDEQARAVIGHSQPSDPQSLASYRDLVGSAWRQLIDQQLPLESSIELEDLGTKQIDGIQITRRLLRNVNQRTELPILVVHRADQKSDRAVIWTDTFGKNAGFDAQGPNNALRQLVDRGHTVFMVDVIGQGEFSIDGKPWPKQRLIDDKRSYSAFTFGYNPTLVSQRCGDLLTVVAHAKHSTKRKVDLLATGQSVYWAMPAAVIAGDAITRAAVETDGGRYADAQSYADVRFVPGSVKYGDLPALMALRAPHALAISGEDKIPEVAESAYSTEKGIHPVLIQSDDPVNGLVEWLVR